tara:strand:- start:488 stop:1081 length:594 start_codon:yes stop_codon:yes gene_type:complete
MVEILCPHCEKEIELEDDASGDFACPYCDGEFEWGVDEELDTFMSDIDTEIVVNQPGQQNIQIQAKGETNTIAIVAIVFAGLALMGALGGAWVPLFGLCNLLFVIPAVIIAYMSRSKIQHVQEHKDAGLVKAGWIISLVSLALTVLPQIFWLVFIFVFADAGDLVADGWFDCGNGESVPEMFVNDGEWDCSNGADEN